jgi:NTP pyrophosphatase (non-canonical NTP hydrolase)
MTSSDQDATLAEVKEMVRRFCAERDWDPYHGPKDLAIGLVTEASELLELFRFIPEKDLGVLLRDEKTRAHIADELADSLYFILRFAQFYGFDLYQCLAEKLIKNAAKYPKP